MAYRQINLTNGTNSLLMVHLCGLAGNQQVCTPPTAHFLHYEMDLFARCGPGIERESVESMLQIQQRYNNHVPTQKLRPLVQVCEVFAPHLQSIWRQ